MMAVHYLSMLKKETVLEFCDIKLRIRKNIIRLRRERGMSVRELGKLSGMSYISRIEGGSKSIGKKGVIRLAEALKVDLEEFFRAPDKREGKEDQLLRVFKTLSTAGQNLLIEQAKLLCSYETRVKWLEQTE